MGDDKRHETYITEEEMWKSEENSRVPGTDKTIISSEC